MIGNVVSTFAQGSLEGATAANRGLHTAYERVVPEGMQPGAAAAPAAWRGLMSQLAPSLPRSSIHRESDDVIGLRDELERTEIALEAAAEVAQSMRVEMANASAEASRRSLEARVLRVAFEEVEARSAEEAGRLMHAMNARDESERSLREELEALVAEGGEAVGMAVEVIAHAAMSHGDMEWQR